jgi:hypothetical protein
MLLPMVVSDHKFVSIDHVNDFSVIDHDDAKAITSNMTMINAYSVFCLIICVDKRRIDWWRNYLLKLIVWGYCG